MLEPATAWMTWIRWPSTLPVRRVTAVPFLIGAQGGHCFPDLATREGVIWYPSLCAKTSSTSALTSLCNSSLTPLATPLFSPSFFRDMWEQSETEKYEQHKFVPFHSICIDQHKTSDILAKQKKKTVTQIIHSNWYRVCPSSQQNRKVELFLF